MKILKKKEKKNQTKVKIQEKAKAAINSYLKVEKNKKKVFLMKSINKKR